ncbi:Rpn family recombination-promoting nuclease/putative transposase, partial [Brachyspira hampsonii]
QLVGNNNFVKRIFYYIAKNIVSELRENDAYINVSQMISISFINFNLNIGTEYDIKKEHKCFTFAEINNPNIKLDMVQVHFIEIKRFVDILKSINKDDYNKNKLLSWIDFFTTKDLEKDINKLIGGNKIMNKVIDKYKRFVADEKEMSAYNERDTFLYGQAVMLEYEREEGRKEGRLEGIKEGIKENQILTAKNMKNKNMDINLISELTGLSIEEIKNL